MKPDVCFSSFLNLPYGNDVGEEQEKAEETAVPGTWESLQGHHDNREGNQRQKQRFGQLIELKVQQTNLKENEELGQNHILKFSFVLAFIILKYKNVLTLHFLL